jgi:RluA family pseudouridine synthase
MKSTVLAVGHKEKTATLLDFLAARLALSRKKAKRLLDERCVLVNRHRIWMARHPLRHGDVVEVLRAPPPAAAPAVLLQDDDYVVVNKPPGIESTGPDSVEALLRRAGNEPGLAAAHRLDRDTSGCLMFARNPAALEDAVAAFRAGSVTKTYHAIVSGCLRTPGLTVDRPLDRQRAVTRLRTVSAVREASHLAVRIETGRTHQIRRHLAELHHPVIGDRQYAVGRQESERSLEAPRQMLHASTLQVRVPRTGRTLLATAPLPGDFRRCLRRLGLDDAPEGKGRRDRRPGSG